jgi:UDP-N-acetylmuramoyl-tripeptide--D-alanyl-D-alanine ligase
VVWADSEPLRRALRAYDARLIRFGADDSAELRLTGYEPRGGAGRFELNGRLWVDLPIPGRHNALNALAAIAVAQRFGFEQDAAAEALADFVGEQMRLEPMAAGRLTIVNDAYNANPASLAAAVAALGSFPGKRRVVVTADMLELGPRSVELHQAAGRAIADGSVNLLVGVGCLGRHIAEGFASAGRGSTEAIESVEAACKTLPKMLKAGDVVLLKGSRAMAMERLVAPIQAAFAAPKRRKKSRKGRLKC